jgi:hypothetical protein
MNDEKSRLTAENAGWAAFFLDRFCLMATM